MYFSLPKLHYNYKALEPYIDCNTMEIHYTKHHSIYTDDLNKIIINTKFKNLTIEEILKFGIYDDRIRLNAGGFYNHSLFWKILSPLKEIKSFKSFLFYIEDNFISFKKFQLEFTDSAMNNSGCGWTWLSITPKTGKLFISSTSNQDNPIMPIVDRIGIPILCLDMWEHAYYLNYKNNRAQYIKSFWKIINWVEVFNIFKNNIILY